MIDIPSDYSHLLFDFIEVVLLSLVIGLEQRRHHEEQDDPSEMLFGTDRTFTFIGILGFVLFSLDAVSLKLFMGGGLVISILLAIFYYNKIQLLKKFGLTSILLALITYCLAPLVIMQPQWLTLLIVVTVLIFTELKEAFLEISKKFDKTEFITLAKFILITGIILPNLPDEQVFSFIQLSPYKMWLAIVVTSGISYFSYLLQKFVFPRSGIIVSGILGGLYSSTAVSLILSRKSMEKSGDPHQYASAIIFATTVMYLRVFLIVLFLQPVLIPFIYAYILVFILISFGTGFIIYRRRTKSAVVSTHEISSQKNPLEFRIALLFAVFYILFSFLTHFAESKFGAGGLNFLGFLAGFADVDSYIMNLIQGKFAVSSAFIATSIVIATSSNNFIKSVYCSIFAEKKTKQLLLIGFGIILIANIAAILFMLFTSS